MNKTIGIVTLLATLSVPALAQISVNDAWVRATVPQQRGTGAYMSITATRDARLIEVSSPLAGVAEVHEMRMEGNVMRMRPLAGLDLPAGKAVELKPGGYHIMLMALKQQMKDGDSVPLTLVIEDKDKKRETIEVKALVRPLTSDAKKTHGH